MLNLGTIRSKVAKLVMPSYQERELILICCNKATWNGWVTTTENIELLECHYQSEEWFSWCLKRILNIFQLWETSGMSSYLLRWRSLKIRVEIGIKKLISLSYKRYTKADGRCSLLSMICPTWTSHWLAKYCPTLNIRSPSIFCWCTQWNPSSTQSWTALVATKTKPK